MNPLTNGLDSLGALKGFEVGASVLLIALLLAVGLVMVRQREHHETVLARLDRLEGIEPAEEDQRFPGHR
jgi:hypothetical protein